VVDAEPEGGWSVGRVAAICVSERKGTVKHAVPAGELRADHGLVGDAHAGSGPRQISLLAAESIAQVRRIMVDLADGAFGENIVTEGVALASLAPGDRLGLGETVLLEVVQLGKECHEGCAIRQQTGDCIMPREGVFCRVIHGGELAVDDPVRIEASRTGDRTGAARGRE
jgi:MOSC domain-containing protein YiiM